jgi:hypothetical protein
MYVQNNQEINELTSFDDLFRLLVDDRVMGDLLVQDVDAIRAFSDDMREVYPQLALFDNKDIRVCFLADPACAFSQLVSRVLPTDDKYFLVFPRKYLELPPREAQEYLMADMLLFLSRFGAAYCMSWSRGQEISDEFMHKLKTRYQHIMTSALFRECSIRPRKYVAHKMASINFQNEPVNVHWECEHERDGGADMVMELEMLPTTFIRYDPTLGVTDIPKNGQVKLAIMELNYLTHLLLKGHRFDTVVILGASPGYHYSLITRCFPGIRFYAIDKNPMCPTPNLDFIPYEDEIDFIFLEPGGGGRRRVAVISDIYDETRSLQQELVARYVAQMSPYADVVAVMEKFRMDWKVAMVPTYTGCRYWFQPFLTKHSGEARLVWYPPTAVREYVSQKKLLNAMHMHNQFMRPRAKKDGRCFDCHYLYMVAEITQAITGVNIIPHIKKIMVYQDFVPDAFRVLKKVQTYAALQQKEDVGVVVKGKKVKYSLGDTPWGAVFRCGDYVIKIPKPAMTGSMFNTGRQPKENYTPAKVVWVNDKFLIHVAPYYVEGGGIVTNAYGRKKRYNGWLLGCFKHVVKGDPPGMFLDLRMEITSACGCVWRKTGDAQVSITYDDR